MNDKERLKQKEIKLKAAADQVVSIIKNPTKTQQQKELEVWQILQTWDS